VTLNAGCNSPQSMNDRLNALNDDAFLVVVYEYRP